MAAPETTLYTETALYDHTLRRDTPLARKLIARIRAEGPLTVREYMDACLNDPEHGYYRTRTAIGRTGDFTTAPEISQIFGELIGLWCAVVWQQMGSPAHVRLVELGAGRGTLLSDALRASRRVSGFAAALSVHIVDQNPDLIDLQRAALASSGLPATWHTRLDGVPQGLPSIWVANEFLDTVPVEQFDRIGGRWATRAIGLDGAGALAFVPTPSDWHIFTDAEIPCHTTERATFDGDLYESQSWERPIVGPLQAHAAAAPLAALFIDYGYIGGAHIDTLQAVREHKPEHVLTSPGEADLSCHVDFDNFAYGMTHPVAAPVSGTTMLMSDGAITQAEFLGRLGIMERASRLMASNPSHANALEMGVARLMAPQGMGTRFKALGIRSAHLPTLPAFEAAG